MLIIHVNNRLDTTRLHNIFTQILNIPFCLMSVRNQSLTNHIQVVIIKDNA